MTKYGRLATSNVVYFNQKYSVLFRQFTFVVNTTPAGDVGDKTLTLISLTLMSSVNVEA